MDILTAFRIVLRRWHVVVSGLILTAVVAVVVMQSISPTFEARGSVLVVSPPPAEGEGVPSVLSENPFARFDAGTTVLAGVTAQLMDDLSVREGLEERGAKADYVVVQENSSAPILTVIVEDKDESVAIESTLIVLNAINDELNARQADAGAPVESRIRSLVIAEPTRTTRLVAARVRAAVATALLGSAAALSMAFVVEGFSQSRRRQQELAAAKAEENVGSAGYERDAPGHRRRPPTAVPPEPPSPTDGTPSEQVTPSRTSS